MSLFLGGAPVTKKFFSVSHVSLLCVFWPSCWSQQRAWSECWCKFLQEHNQVISSGWMSHQFLFRQWETETRTHTDTHAQTHRQKQTNRHTHTCTNTQTDNTLADGGAERFEPIFWNSVSFQTKEDSSCMEVWLLLTKSARLPFGVCWKRATPFTKKAWTKTNVLPFPCGHVSSKTNSVTFIEGTHATPFSIRQWNLLLNRSSLWIFEQLSIFVQLWWDHRWSYEWVMDLLIHSLWWTMFSSCLCQKWTSSILPLHHQVLGVLSIWGTEVRSKRRVWLSLSCAAQHCGMNWFIFAFVWDNYTLIWYCLFIKPLFCHKTVSSWLQKPWCHFALQVSLWWHLHLVVKIFKLPVKLFFLNSEQIFLKLV